MEGKERERERWSRREKGRGVCKQGDMVAEVAKRCPGGDFVSTVTSFIAPDSCSRVPVCMREMNSHMNSLKQQSAQVSVKGKGAHCEASLWKTPSHLYVSGPL